MAPAFDHRSYQGDEGQHIELTGEVTRIDEEGGRVTIAMGPLVTVDIDKIRLVEKYRPPKRKKPLRDMVD
ncbi:conserved hypothetical protein [Mesorhizobium prunaredense]|uniref:Uncharacterized protein n=1 Tax=Mesorhizobium prunaredense TaxID=1631249 RepID=A0A1R3V686_9HYPH|nr:conserved hypothetical protein [Mesorhizobium prunaredense]